MTIYLCHWLYRVSLHELHRSIVRKVWRGKIWNLNNSLKLMGTTKLKYFQDDVTISTSRNRYEPVYFKWHFVCLSHFCIQRRILGEFWFSIPINNHFWDIWIFLAKINCFSIYGKLFTFDRTCISFWKGNFLTVSK